MKKKTFTYKGHKFRSLGSLKENGITFQEALDNSRFQNSLNLNYMTGFNFEAFYFACGDDKAAVFGCEGKIYVPLRSGLHELNKC